jgi:hypothetical protein
MINSIATPLVFPSPRYSLRGVTREPPPLVSKFTSLNVAVLSCTDRVIFNGHLALAARRELEYFVDRILKVRRPNFMRIMGTQHSDRLVARAQDWAQEDERTYPYSHRRIPQGRMGSKSHPRTTH